MLDRGCARRLGGVSGWDEETALISRTKKHPWLRISRNERGPFWMPIGGPFCVPIDTEIVPESVIPARCLSSKDLMAYGKKAGNKRSKGDLEKRDHRSKQ